jgi:hypothetical protein
MRTIRMLTISAGPDGINSAKLPPITVPAAEAHALVHAKRAEYAEVAPAEVAAIEPKETATVAPAERRGGKRK